jgi:hypothetical protein
MPKQLLAGLALAILLVPTPLSAAARPASDGAATSLIVATTDLCTGRPLGEGLVTISGAKEIVQANRSDGLATFMGLPAGDYLVSEQAPGYETLGGEQALAAHVDMDGVPPIIQFSLAPVTMRGPGACVSYSP